MNKQKDMSNNKFVVLLRGINVGGKNLIKMTDLKGYLEELAFTDVITYIQSGNILLSADKQDELELTLMLEHKLSERFNYPATLILLNSKNYSKVIENKPDGFGVNPELFRYNVLFFKNSFNIYDALKEIKTKEGVDTVEAGDHVLYFTQLKSKAAQSKLSSIIKLPVYQHLTIRNWNTTLKLWELLQN